MDDVCPLPWPMPAAEDAGIPSPRLTRRCGGRTASPAPWRGWCRRRRCSTGGGSTCGTAAKLQWSRRAAGEIGWHAARPLLMHKATHSDAHSMPRKGASTGCTATHAVQPRRPCPAQPIRPPAPAHQQWPQPMSNAVTTRSPFFRLRTCNVHGWMEAGGALGGSHGARKKLALPCFFRVVRRTSGPTSSTTPLQVGHTDTADAKGRCAGAGRDGLGESRQQGRHRRAPGGGGGRALADEARATVGSLQGGIWPWLRLT